MLIKESHADVTTTVNGAESSMRIFTFSPVVPQYPNARFPGVVLFSEIYQVTGPVARFARQIAGQGYIVAAPSSYHDFTGPEPLAYDVPGTDQGNEWKVKKVSKLPPDAFSPPTFCCRRVPMLTSTHPIDTRVLRRGLIQDR